MMNQLGAAVTPLGTLSRVSTGGNGRHNKNGVRNKFNGKSMASEQKRVERAKAREDKYRKAKPLHDNGPLSDVMSFVESRSAKVTQG